MTTPILFSRQLVLAFAALSAADVLLVLVGLAWQSATAIRVLSDLNSLAIPAILATAGVSGVRIWNARPYERIVLRTAAVFLLLAVASIGLGTSSLPSDLLRVIWDFLRSRAERAGDGFRFLAAAADPVIRFLVANTPTGEMVCRAGPVAVVWAALCLHVAARLKSDQGMKTGYTRKVFHFLVFLTAAGVHGIWGTRAVCLWGTMVTLVVFYAVFRGNGHPFYEALAREKDAPRRTYYVVIPYFATLVGGLATNILFGPLALFGYLVTGVGDAIGEPVGTRYGKHPYRVFSWGPVQPIRTVEGSVAVGIASWLAILAGIAMTPGMALDAGSAAVALGIAATCAAVEAVAPHGWDNAFLQVVPSALAAVFFGRLPA